MTGTRIRITLKRHEWGGFYGVEAHDEGGALLAKANQVGVENNGIVVEETQFAGTGAVLYRGKLFFDPGGELIRSEGIDGRKTFDIFSSWNYR